MKKPFTALFCLLTTISILAQQPVDLNAEQKAIKETALNYIEGWFTGNAARMNKALHPNLVKRAIAPDRETGKIGIRYPATKKQMIEWTSKHQEKRPAEEWNFEVKILDIQKYSASVKISSCDFIDYAHMVKEEDEWKILNVVWEYTEKK